MTVRLNATLIAAAGKRVLLRANCKATAAVGSKKGY